MQTAEMVQRRMTTFRFSEDEYARLDAVAKHYALTASGVIRMLVKREHDELIAKGAAAVASNQASRPKPAPKKAKAKRTK